MNELLHMSEEDLNALPQKDTRSGFGQGLLELGNSNPNVVALCADLTGSLKMNAFEDAHPDRDAPAPHLHARSLAAKVDGRGLVLLDGVIVLEHVVIQTLRHGRMRRIARLRRAEGAAAQGAGHQALLHLLLLLRWPRGLSCSRQKRGVAQEVRRHSDSRPRRVRAVRVRSWPG